jgi:hypothetical protein
MRYRMSLAAMAIATTAFAAENPEPHPILSSNGSWVPILLIVIGMLFLAAAVIGPIVRANMPEELPVSHAHDEPPGSSHHHGRSGTINPAPEDEAR